MDFLILVVAVFCYAFLRYIITSLWHGKLYNKTIRKLKKEFANQIY